MFKLLADENIDPRVMEALQKNSYAVERVKIGIDDDLIIQNALKHKRIIITHDKDFGNLLRYPLKKHGGVILIRLKNQSPDNVIRTVIPKLNKLINQCVNSLVVIKEKNIRIKKQKTVVTVYN